MGKQMTYYMEREVFTQLAQIAVDLGCVILKHFMEMDTSYRTQETK